MEEQQRIQPLALERNGNGKYQPFLPVYPTTFQDNKVDEWDLRKFLVVVRRRAIVIGSVAIAISASFWFSTLSRQAQYQGNFRLLVEPVTSESKVESQLEGLTNISGRNQQDGLDYDTQIQVLQSPELLDQIIQQIATRYPDVNYNSLVRNLTIGRAQETKILEVRYQDSDPQKIQFVLQQLARGFLKYSLQERQTNLRQGVLFVDGQMPLLQSRVNGLQKKLQQFRQQYNFIDPEAKAQQISEQATVAAVERVRIQNQLAQSRAFYATLQGKSGEQLAQARASYPTLQQSSEQPSSQNQSSATESLVENQAPIYEGLVGKLRDVESQMAAEAARFREDSPMMTLLRQKRDNLLPVLQQEAKRELGNKLVEVANQISLLELQSARVTKVESNLNQQFKQMPVLARQYNDLQRELTVATESLKRFLEKRESLQIETAQKEIPWQVIAPPELPQVPISPDVKRNLVLGLIAGMLAGLGAALLVERLDNVFHSPDDLKEITKLPLLGTIPFHKNLQPTKPKAKATVEQDQNGYRVLPRNINNVDGYSYFPFLEAFRSLHTNINFLGSDTPIHSLVLSSAVHAEGKSTVAVNLAQAAAAMGQRVLLVDADLRLPQIHSILGLPNEQGLSNVISANLPVSEVIQRSPLSDNLFVLTSGQIPPDPTKLLSSKKMQNIMAQLRQEFDLVIYDTPPILGLADSSLLAAYTAGIVLVVRVGKTSRSTMTQALERLKVSRATVLGTVCNGVINYNSTPYNYYYYRPHTQTAGSN